MDHLVTAIAGFILGTISDGFLGLLGKLRQNRRALCVVVLAIALFGALWHAGNVPGWSVLAAPVVALTVYFLWMRCGRSGNQE